MTESERRPQPQPADEERPPGGPGEGSAAPSSDNTPPRAPGTRADPPSDRGRDDEDVIDPDNEDDLRQNASTINNVYGGLRADTAYLGSVDHHRSHQAVENL